MGCIMQPGMRLDKDLLHSVIHVAEQAGAEIMTVYRRSTGFEVASKADDSPLTEADTRAHQHIERSLLALVPGIPVLSEESALQPFAVRQQWARYWLIDPLDGTREFVSRNGEFTVNIALIEQGRPVLGVVHVPVTGVTYSALTQGGDAGAWRQSEPISVRQLPAYDAWADVTLNVVASRRHGGEQLARVLAMLQRQAGSVELVNMGSSLKICLLAEGKADLYPRFAPTSEWDIAAAHAVLLAAGGDIVDLAFDSMAYNRKESILNPSFIAFGCCREIWADILG
ncbi:MAG: 3'(2'),5'-bisphosphate nucleotidase CysQ [Pseudohongiella sp.]